MEPEETGTMPVFTLAEFYGRQRASTSNELSNVRDIVIFPPEDGSVTDEDSDDEDTTNLDHLTPAQLISEAEVNFEDDGTRETAQDQRINNKKNQAWGKKRWSKNEKIFKERAGRGDSDEITKNDCRKSLTAIECFESLFTEDIMQMLVDMSNGYALQRNHNLNLTLPELKIYIAILLLTGYLTPKHIRLFWEGGSDVHNNLVSGSIRRNRFLEIHQYLHTCDNLHLPPNDKFAKLRQYFNMLNEIFLQNFKAMTTSHVSIDETMIPYFGRHSSKQHIHGKPIRFGYKIWSAASRLGYLICFEPYQGAKSGKLKCQDELGLGASVILELASRLPEEGKPYNLYFDNFFSGLPLLDKLSQEGFGGTGTIRENRLQKCPVEDSKSLKKKPRGSFSVQVLNNMAVVKWHDNSIVTLVSNCHSNTPVSKVDRVAVIEKQRVKVSVTCPNAVVKYNKYMGGVDRFDENIDSQRVSLRGKKWWYPLFAFGLDASCHNAWKLYQYSSEAKLTYLQFRRLVVQSYLGSYGTKPKRANPGGNTSLRVPAFVRQDQDEQHSKEACKQKRCALCHKHTRIQCVKCKVGLHVNCWYQFHTK